MAPLKKSLQFGLDRSGLKDSVRSLFVPDFPMKNVICLFFSIFPENRGVVIKRAMWIHENREILILHLDQLSGVGRGVSIFSNHERDLLRLKQHLSGRQDHLPVVE